MAAAVLGGRVAQGLDHGQDGVHFALAHPYGPCGGGAHAPGHGLGVRHAEQGQGRTAGGGQEAPTVHVTPP
ncbi:hypothetical protein [Streptomyces sp. TLI_146]|uniref:hypothetical protein n=1 Tax=Streptomyces sp. TLI_146 TaxID=1938858 RepID=UPI00117FED2D|nr:hypothetical protein [Streptomyces sp. TLI_146]